MFHGYLYSGFLGYLFIYFTQPCQTFFYWATTAPSNTEMISLTVPSDILAPTSGYLLFTCESLGVQKTLILGALMDPLLQRCKLTESS